MKIVVAENYHAMSETAAELVIKQIQRKRNSVLALPTGKTPIGLYCQLVKTCQRDKLSLRQARIFILDEYIGLAKSDKRSFHYLLNELLFARTDVKDENIFCFDGKVDDLKKACVNYEELIDQRGGIDLLILGIGLNGHIAFNEPGSDFNSKTRVVNLAEKTRRTNTKSFGHLRQVPRRAITMGLGTIMKAKKIILIAAGKAKAKIIKRALAGKITKSVPASILQKHKSLIVVLDREAAGQLAALAS